MKRRHISVDIETLGTPELSGYDIIIPNYAAVVVPSKPENDIHQFLYVKLPYQDQVAAGLKSDAGAMDFWMNTCQKEYPNAYTEVASTMKIKAPELYGPNEQSRRFFAYSSIVDFWKELRYNEHGEEVPHSVWGNGCNFDCSILQANHLKLMNAGELWKYDAPENARTLKRLLNEEARIEMDEIVSVQLAKFVTYANKCGINGLELHHPLFDAAREAIQISFCLNKLKMD
ncbi:3'-5' exoribonuclease [Escherichia coli]|nr:3'-5' exoribonuclease [Escherichia coli]